MTMDIKNAKSMAGALRWILDDLCVEWGFCIPNKDAERISNTTHVGADEFACLVLEAEGMDAEMELKHRRAIRNRFRQHFGNELDISDFRDVT